MLATSRASRAPRRVTGPHGPRCRQVDEIGGSAFVGFVVSHFSREYGIPFVSNAFARIRASFPGGVRIGPAEADPNIELGSVSVGDQPVLPENVAAAAGQLSEEAQVVADDALVEALGEQANELINDDVAVTLFTQAINKLFGDVSKSTLNKIAIGGIFAIVGVDAILGAIQGSIEKDQLDRERSRMNKALDACEAYLRTIRGQFGGLNESIARAATSVLATIKLLDQIVSMSGTAKWRSVMTISAGTARADVDKWIAMAREAATFYVQLVDIRNKAIVFTNGQPSRTYDQFLDAMLAFAPNRGIMSEEQYRGLIEYVADHDDTLGALRGSSPTTGAPAASSPTDPNATAPAAPPPSTQPSLARPRTAASRAAALPVRVAASSLPSALSTKALEDIFHPNVTKLQRNLANLTAQYKTSRLMAADTHAGLQKLGASAKSMLALMESLLIGAAAVTADNDYFESFAENAEYGVDRPPKTYVPSDVGEHIAEAFADLKGLRLVYNFGSFVTKGLFGPVDKGAAEGLAKAAAAIAAEADALGISEGLTITMEGAAEAAVLATEAGEELAADANISKYLPPASVVVLHAIGAYDGPDSVSMDRHFEAAIKKAHNEVTAVSTYLTRASKTLYDLEKLVVNVEKEFYHLMQNVLTKVAPAEHAFGFPFDVAHADDYVHAMGQAVKQYSFLATIRVRHHFASKESTVDWDRFLQEMIHARPATMDREFVSVLVQAVRDTVEKGGLKPKAAAADTARRSLSFSRRFQAMAPRSAPAPPQEVPKADPQPVAAAASTAAAAPAKTSKQPSWFQRRLSFRRRA